MTSASHTIAGAPGTVTVVPHVSHGYPGIRLEISWKRLRTTLGLYEDEGGRPLTSYDPEATGDPLRGFRPTRAHFSDVVRVTCGRAGAARCLASHFIMEPPDVEQEIPASYDGWSAAVRGLVSDALADAAVTPPFREAIQAVMRWPCAPDDDPAAIGPLFDRGESGQAVRAFVRKHPFLSAFLVRRFSVVYGNGPESAEAVTLGVIPGMTPEMAAAFARAPWSDIETAPRLWGSRDGARAYAPATTILVSGEAFRGIRPEDMPGDAAGAQAFLAVLSALKRTYSSITPPEAVAWLASTVGRDWERMAARLEEAEGLGDHPIEALWGAPARILATKVLAPIHAREGTLEGSDVGEGRYPGERLDKEAASMMVGGLTLDNAITMHATGYPAALPGIPDEASAVEDEWGALFPETVVDGITLRCVTSPGGLVRLGISEPSYSGHSLRLLASTGGIHIVECRKASEGKHADLIAILAVGWSEGRWKDIRLVAPRFGTHGAVSASLALKEALSSLGEAPRPCFWPIPAHELARDVCGYDWRSHGLVEQACEAVAALLPPGMASLESLTASVRKADLTRITPLYSKWGSQNRPLQGFFDLP